MTGSVIVKGISLIFVEYRPVPNTSRSSHCHVITSMMHGSHYVHNNFSIYY